MNPAWDGFYKNPTASNGCGLFLWKEDAKQREIQALSNSSSTGQMPLSASTPSRKLRQPKISEWGNGFQKNSPSSRNTENAKPTTTDKVSYPELPELDKRDVMDLTEDSQEKWDNYESASEDFDSPRKVPRTMNNTSPTKRALSRERADYTTSFISTSTIPDEVTPSTRFQHLALRTPATNARLAVQRGYDSVQPVRPLNLQPQNGARTLATKVEPGNPFTSGVRPSAVEQTPGGTRVSGDEIIDAQAEIFGILERARLTLPEPFNAEMQQLATRLRFKQMGYKKSRDGNRDIYKKERERLEAEIEILNDKLESSMHLQHTDKASISSQQSEIDDLKKEVESLKLQLGDLANIEVEKVRLQDECENLNRLLKELGDDIDV
ncbi:hypothetical protein AA313_de0203008 [Arthrobotrys entomopaga]|nr:hypothetical protein AA313_de0203008 [Arthrobotrys entomopaga]